MAEVITLAQASGVALNSGDITAWYRVLQGMAPAGKTSMLQDLEAGRKTEVEMFAGKVVALGEKLGLATPVNQTLYQIIQVLEARSAGQAL